MAKADVVAAAKAMIVQEQDQALTDGLGSAYDGGVADQKAADQNSGLTQNDVDNAVAAAVAPLKAQIAQDATDLAKAQSDAQAALGAVQAQLTDMTAKEQAEEKVIAGLQSSVASVQAALDAIKSIVLPPQT